MARRTGGLEGTPPEPVRNSVVLCGRVSMAADERELPSGDTVVITRVVVDREVPRGASSGQARPRQRVDAIDCVAWKSAVRRTVRRWQPGDRVFLEGAIRRRFYRTGRGVVSRVEVEITQARRVATPGPKKRPARAEPV